MLSLSFDDVLLVPKFSTVSSRRDVDITSNFIGKNLAIPIISSNMDSVTDSKIANIVEGYGGLAALHRFCSIQDNVTEFIKSPTKTIVSVGVGEYELKRTIALAEAGAINFMIDVAHGASKIVADQALAIRKIIGEDASLIIGNFATAESLEMFLDHCNTVDAVKVGIGGGSACTTRVVTGVGIPTLGSILDIKDLGIPIIADGGIRDSGDFAKAIALGASVCMVGRLFAQCEESPAKVVDVEHPDGKGCPMKIYRGSASMESYMVQDKVSDWRTAEGESYPIPIKGTVRDLMLNMSAGLRSSMSYLNAHNLTEFQNSSNFEIISGLAHRESRAHGK